MAEKDSDERQACTALVVQSNVLARYAAQCETGARRKEASSFEKEVLTERATLARAMAGVMFRAGTSSYGAEGDAEARILHPSGCAHCRSEIKS